MSPSMLPSQLLSLPSQISGAGPTKSLHTSRPPSHSRWPGAHSPSSSWQGSPSPGRTPSSAVPSQSSSTPLQISPAQPVHWRPSSTTPSQSSSMPLQPGGSFGGGMTKGALHSVSVSLTHTKLPSRKQAPCWPLSQGPRLKPLSATPSQSSSSPLHFS